MIALRLNDASLTNALALLRRGATYDRVNMADVYGSDLIHDCRDLKKEVARLEALLAERTDTDSVTVVVHNAGVERARTAGRPGF